MTPIHHILCAPHPFPNTEDPPERTRLLPEDAHKEPPRVGQLIALADALRSGSLNPAQTELVRALREGLGQLEDVKVRAQAPANSEN